MDNDKCYYLNSSFKTSKAVKTNEKELIKKFEIEQMLSINSEDLNDILAVWSGKSHSFIFK